MLVIAATDLILFSVEPGVDGSVAELGRLTTDALDAARAAREQHGTRLHICVGGAGRSAAFGPVAASPALRKQFGACCSTPFLVYYPPDFSLRWLVFQLSLL